MSEAFEDIGYSAPITKLDRKTKWPADMAIPEKWIQDGYAIRKRHGLMRVRLALEAEKFVNWAAGSGSKKIDWHRTWLNWCLSPYCKGEPEQEPLEQDKRLECVTKLWNKGIRTQSMNLFDVREAVRRGLMTPETARKFGFHVALD